MENLSLLLQQDANKFFPDMRDFEVSYPPHWNGRVSHTFFLKKRKWLRELVDFWWDEVLDYMEFNWDKYALIKDWTNVKLKKNNSSTTLRTATYNSTPFYSLKTVSACSGTLLNSWTSITWSIVSTTYKLTDATKTRTVNAYAWKTVYLPTWTAWAWQMFKIISNTATELIVDSMEAVPTACAYQIYDSFWEVVAFTGNDWIYTVNNDTSVNKVAFTTKKVIDFTYSVWRLFVIVEWWQVRVSGTFTWANMWWGYLGLFFSWESAYKWTIADAMRIVQYQSFIVVLCSSRIVLMKEQSITITWAIELKTWTPQTVSNFVWLYSASSLNIYNEWLYMLTSSKRFVLLKITSVGVDKYVTSIDDAWANIQQFLDWIISTDSIDININQDEIIITHATWSLTNIYIYNQYYKFRHRRSTKLNITWVTTFVTPIFFGDSVYKYNTGFLTDEWDEEIKDYIKIVTWEDDIFAIKNYLLNKIYIWRNTSPTTEIKYSATLDWQTYITKTTIWRLTYLTNAAAFRLDATLWTNVLWFWRFGWDANQEYMLDNIVSAINTIEVPMWISAILLKTEIEWDFEFGGMLFGYDKLDPHVSTLDSVVWFNS